MKHKLGLYLFVFGFFGFFLALAVVLTFDLKRDVERGRASIHWPTVAGEVVDVFRSRNRPAVEYRYVVDGAVYVSRRVAFVRRRSFQSGRGLQPYYGRDFSEGASVPVYYNPADPGESVLMPGTPLSGILVEGFAAGFLFFIGGGGMGLGVASMRKPSDRKEDRQVA